VASEDPDGRFGLYLICTGFGRENCDLEPLLGFPFWSSDPIPQPFFGCGNSAPRILISGGGDGAQQDLLRLAFIVPPLQVLRAIFDGIDTAAGMGRKHQEQLTRAVARIQKEYALPLVGEEFMALVDSISSEIWGSIKASVRALLRVEFTLSSVSFAFPKSYLPKCFPLNHILVLILRRYVLEELRRDIFLPRTVIGPIVTPTAEHPCNIEPRLCWGVPHQIELTTDGVKNYAEFDIIIIRHGLFPL
jgi:hypothetical protein